MTMKHGKCASCGGQLGMSWVVADGKEHCSFDCRHREFMNFFSKKESTDQIRDDLKNDPTLNKDQLIMRLLDMIDVLITERRGFVSNTQMQADFQRIVGAFNEINNRLQAVEVKQSGKDN